jgi:hypothetical protein
LKKSDSVMKTFRFLLIAVIVILADGGIAPGQCVPAPSGMVAWWPMDDTTGAASLIDIISGNNAEPMESPVGAFQAPRSVKGKVNGAIKFQKFDRTGLCGARVSAQGALQHIGSADFTIDAWIKFPPPKAVDRSHYIIRKFHGHARLGYCLYIVSRGAINNARLEFIWGDGGNIDTLQTTRAITPNRWHHVAVTFARNVGKKALDIGVYVDGSRQVHYSGNPRYLTSLVNFIIMQIGSQPSSDDEPITIDELTIFNRALNSSEVRTIWAVGGSGKCKPSPGVSK